MSKPTREWFARADAWPWLGLLYYSITETYMGWIVGSPMDSKSNLRGDKVMIVHMNGEDRTHTGLRKHWKNE